MIDKAIAMIPDHHSSINVKSDIPRIALNIDETKMTLALRNLLDNALKF